MLCGGISSEFGVQSSELGTVTPGSEPHTPTPNSRLRNQLPIFFLQIHVFRNKAARMIPYHAGRGFEE